MNGHANKILVISAHAVDFLWRCGGTIRKSADHGADVKIVDLAFGERGESSHAWRTVENVTVEEVKEIRRKEATEISKALGASSITLLCIIGPYALNNNVFEVWIMIGAGIIGFFLKGFGISAGPIILGLILGPLVEANFRAALELSDGDVSIFVTDPLSAIILAITLVLIAWPFLKNFRSHKK